MAELEGKVALVTGGSRGIGAAIAQRLADEGADVAVTYVQAAHRAHEVTANLAAAGRRALAIGADVAEPGAIEAAVEQAAAQLGRLDILVNNAGIFPFGPLEDVTAEELDHTLAVHVRGVFTATQAAALHMGDGGRVISIGSCYVDRVPHAGLTLYAMTKSALTGLTKGLARDLGPRGITANVVHPGPTDTDMNPAGGENAEAEAAWTAARRYASPDEIAATVAHLAGSGGRYITGAAISVDGGFSA